jgi:signal transduction histidine kinase
LNSYSIQNVFALIPQDKLIGNINKQKEFVNDLINKKTNETASTILRLIKYILAMKVEFSVYERTIKPLGSVQKLEQRIRPLVLSVLQIFMQDFESKDIEVSLDASEVSDKLLSIDNDSLFVSLFYVLDNAVKYCCPRTKFKIIFEEEKSCFSILFKMVSLRIESDEISKLTIRGYRSKTAIELNQKGEGLGMYRIQKTLRLNGAELEIIPRYFEFPKRIGNINYEGNLFKIKFMGQQSWFANNFK